MSHEAQHLKTEAEQELMPEKSPQAAAAGQPRAATARRRLQVAELTLGPLMDPSEISKLEQTSIKAARASKPALRLKAEASPVVSAVSGVPLIPKPLSTRASQRAVDAKAFNPFTGTGTDRFVQEARRDVDSVHTKMRELAELSSQFVKWGLRLNIHTRGQTKQLSLRWRGYRPGGRTDLPPRQEHLSWDQAEQRIAAFPSEVRAQYSLWNETALALNELEKRARFTLKNAEKLVATGTASPRRAQKVLDSLLQARETKKVV